MSRGQGSRSLLQAGARTERISHSIAWPQTSSAIGQIPFLRSINCRVWAAALLCVIACHTQNICAEYLDPPTILHHGNQLIQNGRICMSQGSRTMKRNSLLRCHFLPNLGNESDKHCDVGGQEESQKILRGGKGSALLPTLTISKQQERGPSNLSYRLQARYRVVGNNKRQV